jgi:hypothetical protein
MSRKKAEPVTDPTVTSFLREITESDEFRGGLRRRLEAGTATSAELRLLTGLTAKPATDPIAQAEAQRKLRDNLAPHEQLVLSALLMKVEGTSNIRNNPSTPVIDPSTRNLVGLRFTNPI